MPTFAEYDRYDALGLANLVKTRQLTPSDLVEEAIRRIDVLNPRINAVVTTMYEQARATAKGALPDGPFTGVPFLLKDLISTYAGVPTSGGNRVLRQIPTAHDSELVRRFKAAGVVVVGKSNTPEFGLTPYTESDTLGATRNPWDLERSPGGSSGGSAAAVAAGMVPMASGGDGGGSIRIPASCCGVFGLKPSRGRMPTGPDEGEIWHGYTIEHVITRSVRDSAAMLDAVGGADVGAPYGAPPAGSFLRDVTTAPDRLRIAFTTRPLWGHTTHEDCEAGLRSTADLLRQLGHEAIEAAPTVDGESCAIAYLTIIAAEIRADVETAARAGARKVKSSDFEAATYAVALLGRALRASDYANASRLLQATSREVGRFFQEYDVLLTPTLSQPPIAIGELRPTGTELATLKAIGRLNLGWLLGALGVIKPLAAKTFDFMPYTPLFNVTGQPAMSVPLYWNGAGLPIGMQFVGRFGDESTLFRLAGQLERAQPWFDRRPAAFAENVPDRLRLDDSRPSATPIELQ
jgi:amidase